ncbi:hypothetical protein TIFTF001_015636 [Ficus carica]|uniref:Uncharacterized protein n=1 Tax=Ficus carica TaxID=3494 RepID=A0AA88AI38_FICCA|nr:hypothetical protein TIFTF001_015636 [Ficus carica]
MEGSSEKNQASSPASERVDLRSSTLENEETGGPSEKNQASSPSAVMEVENSEAGVDDQMDASQASTVLPENDMPSTVDPSSSSVVMEDKMMEGKEDVQGQRSVLENMDQPQEASVTDGDNDTTGHVGSIVPPSKSESEVKAGVASPSIETVPECEKKDLPPCSSEQEGVNVEKLPEDPLGSPVRLEETKESQVD